jgi:hypothetical protein
VDPDNIFSDSRPERGKDLGSRFNPTAPPGFVNAAQSEKGGIQRHDRDRFSKDFVDGLSLERQ